MPSPSLFPAGRDFDRLIQTLYSLAVEDDWQSFRPHALQLVCSWLGANSGAWLTRSESERHGQYCELPPHGNTNREALASLPFRADQRELRLDPLPMNLRAAGETGTLTAYAFSYVHRGSTLTSTVLLRFGEGKQPTDLEPMQRAVGHLVEAAALSLRNFIQRDEWLSALGRPSRGTAALVDGKGTIYAASKRFREIIGQQANAPGDFTRLPFRLPESVLEGEEAFFQGALHFRVSRQGQLYLLHARRPLPLDALSPREQEIARALGNGKTFKSVARQYDIAVSTVANHASRIYRKLGIYRREDLVDLVRTPGVAKSRG